MRNSGSRFLNPLITIIVLGAVVWTGTQLFDDLRAFTGHSALAYVLLGVALTIALGFEFVNGFHDTANAVATVIYTRSLPANVAVVWSGAWNLTGVLVSSGVVAFGIISLLPVELILQVGSAAGFAMVFALLIAAIIWNLGTWWLGLPSSSSHTLIGSVIGVGLMNQLMGGADGTSGVDWSQATKIGYSLLASPAFGFILAALLLLALKSLVRAPELYRAPNGHQPPPFWIRSLLILTCTGVSFFHGSNDGQKGMGLIMLILIGIAPTAYALNRSMNEDQIQTFIAISDRAATTISRYAAGPAPAPYREEVTRYIETRQLDPGTMAAELELAKSIRDQVAGFQSIAGIPRDQVGNVRNDMYLADDALRFMKKSGAPAFTAEDQAVIDAYRDQLDTATRFIPLWVKVAVAIALGMGTMIGWKRIVVTVGEKIGKDHLTYAQGAAAEIVAMVCIGAADGLGLPVSTTHVLSSGVAGTMAANGSGLQWSTVRSLAMAWILTLPVSIALSGGLFWIFRHTF
ncbi:MAG TPA: inorganic phosphate transporter [Alphaproteobacteria bacterium]|nr:inorganic phosphate transporter [Alphaproteobacteria bacterium]